MVSLVLPHPGGPYRQIILFDGGVMEGESDRGVLDKTGGGGRGTPAVAGHDIEVEAVGSDGGRGRYYID
jgi:hypothetical protein